RLSGALHAKFIDLETFNNPTKGYLVNGECTFGAEVFVIKNSIQGQYLPLINDPVTCTNTWKLNRYSFEIPRRSESNFFFFSVDAISGGFCSIPVDLLRVMETAFQCF
ncbi:TRAF-like, partial [Parasponia andersonii]